MEQNPAKTKFNERGIQLPNHYWPPLTDAFLEELANELSAQHIDWLPLPEKNSNGIMANRAKLMAIPSITGFVTNVLSAAQQDGRYRVSLPHFDRDGYIRPTIVYIDEMPDCLAANNLILYDTYTKAPLRSTMDTRAPNIRDAMMYPSIIGETPVDARTIKRVIRAYLSTSNPQKSHAAATTAITMRRLGLSAEKYLKLRYAHDILRDCVKNMTWRQEHGIIPKIYQPFIERFSNPHYDNWMTERLSVPKDQPFNEPNPDAYAVLTKINRPDFEREPENPNAKTFDRVRIYLGIKTRTTFPDRKDFIRKYKKDIIKIALAKITTASPFKRAGIPVQFLKPVSMTITNSDELEILFELKTV